MELTDIQIEKDRGCALSIMGARHDGTPERVAVEDERRESTSIWATVRLNLKDRSNWTERDREMPAGLRGVFPLSLSSIRLLQGLRISIFQDESPQT